MSLLHGHARKMTSEYQAWLNFRQRCNNPNNPQWYLYGGRGVTVCSEWNNSFVAFLLFMGRKPSPLHSIERINNLEGYRPGNCKWATCAEQMRNTRRTRLITFNGMTMCARDWDAKLGFPLGTVGNRITKSKWPIEKALTRPFGRNL